MAIHSSVTAPRRSKSGVFSASNSSFSQPTPTPSVTRPPDSTSSDATIFAGSTGLRYGRIRKGVDRRSGSAVRQDQDGRDQPQLLGGAGDHAQQGEGLERVADARMLAVERVGI